VRAAVIASVMQPPLPLRESCAFAPSFWQALIVHFMSLAKKSVVIYDCFMCM